MPARGEVRTAVSKGEPPTLPYTLSDMADDVIGLMDALELETAHLVGISMGGMIVQEATLRHETRVRSLTSIMSSPSDPGLPGPTDAARASLHLGRRRGHRPRAERARRAAAAARFRAAG